MKNARGEFFLGRRLPQGITEKDVMREHCKHFPFSSRDISRYLEIGTVDMARLSIAMPPLTACATQVTPTTSWSRSIPLLRKYRRAGV